MAQEQKSLWYIQINNNNSSNNITRIGISALAISKINKHRIVAGRMRRLFGDGTH